jgi:hypothetical protein
MDAPTHGRRITIWLSAESYAFVEKLVEAGFAASADELIQVAVLVSLGELKNMLRDSEQLQDSQKH